MQEPLILLTNDDGIAAPGLRTLVNVAKTLGEVVVVAPDSPQSGQGHAITINDPLRIHEVNIFGDEVKAFECTGTPVDCVKLAKHVVLEGRKIDLCLSGINHGSNAGVNIIYSGTMSAAMEASLEGIPSIGFSLLDFTWKADMSVAEPVVKILASYALETQLKDTWLLNVNIPKASEQPLAGIKLCRQANARWVEKFQEGIDPQGRKYYWLTGSFVPGEIQEDTDIFALDHNFVSVVPSAHDLTDYKSLQGLRDINELKLNA